MKKLEKRKITIMAIMAIVAMVFIMILTTTVRADSIVDPITDPSRYDPTGGNVDNGRVAQMGSTIVGIIRTVGSVIALIALVILGLKYMLGSTAEKAKYKESMIPYIIGMVMLLASVNILNILYKIFFKIY